MDCVRRGVFPAGGLLSPRYPRASPSRERVHATSLPKRRPSEDCRLHTCESVGASRNAMSKPAWFRGGGSWDAHLALRARRPVREGVCAVDIGHDAALRGSAFVMQRGCHGARP